jgi:hypothetical protein
MTIRKQTPEDIAAETAQVATLEAAVKDAQTALDLCPDSSKFRYPPPAALRMEADRHRNGLVSAVAEAERALKQARIVQSNNVVYASIIADVEANMAKNAAEKVAQEAQQKGESEAQFKREAENAYCLHGGSALEFARAWPAMRAELIEEKTLATLRENAGVDLVDQYIQKRNQANS